MQRSELHLCIALTPFIQSDSQDRNSPACGYNLWGKKFVVPVFWWCFFFCCASHHGFHLVTLAKYCHLHPIHCFVCTACVTRGHCLLVEVLLWMCEQCCTLRWRQRQSRNNLRFCCLNFHWRWPQTFGQLEQMTRTCFSSSAAAARKCSFQKKDR